MYFVLHIPCRVSLLLLSPFGILKEVFAPSLTDTIPQDERSEAGTEAES